jgi:electron transfer flavoprotein-quinone oxidoreductase
VDLVEMLKREMEGEILDLLRGRRSFFGIAHDMMKLLGGMRG